MNTEEEHKWSSIILITKPLRNKNFPEGSTAASLLHSRLCLWSSPQSIGVPRSKIQIGITNYVEFQSEFQSQRQKKGCFSVRDTVKGEEDVIFEAKAAPVAPPHRRLVSLLPTFGWW
ncbi:hypothetical protein H6P81_013814 [Aristolochia fimbriata]|uniref:Uncharacterized protein n=1 Tax=Aristolochia fimbriata TaxID=158543 RepID=A0AAV7EIK0_ARIFI|nr:hypothetical protein H6P81_013814 [Aristolochia fimbriata]